MKLPTPTDWLKDPEQVRLFERRMRAGRMPRRQFLALMGALGGAAALAACGSGAETPTSAPAATAAPTTGAAAATTAPTAAATSATGSATSAATTASPAAGASPAAATGSTKLSNWPNDLPQPSDLAADQTWRSYQNDEPSSFDFNKDLYAGGATYMWEGLLRYDPDFNLCPASATSYEIKNGGQVYTFHINPKATWSNGDPVTADDYVWSWTRQL
ncbi:MAG TPA: ABC transporter substrate-binding protein, partial [Thermomicrobiales bacterium]|nr:ABC transporter substrate-binding protein [Thermomicrobiales bacterium]